jgi:hypothetical protein
MSGQLTMSGGFDLVHGLVLRADNDLTLFGHLTRPTVLAIEATQSWDSNVIYALLHEPCYCQGAASNWSAERLLSKNPDFELEQSDKSTADKSKPLLFTGEMIYPFMFDVYPELKKLKIVGDALAQEKNWPMLYDEGQLKKNEVPMYAAVYMDDMYVDYDLSMETAGKIKGCKTYITNAMYHNALRAKTDDVLKALFALRDDVID